MVEVVRKCGAPHLHPNLETGCSARKFPYMRYSMGWAERHILKEVYMTTHGFNMGSSGNARRQAHLKRAMVGAFYGLLGGMAFVLTAAFIDIWLHPELPLGVNWAEFQQRLPGFVLGLALVGAVTCWWEETWQGLFSGAVVAAALALIVALLTSPVDTGMRVIVLLFTLLPIAVLALPVAYVLRWLIERHARALQMKSSGRRIVGLLLLVILLGAVGGYFLGSSKRAIQAAQFIHNFLQDLARAQTGQNPLARVEGVQERSGTSYTMYSTRSETSTEAFDIHVEYADRYRLLCTVILYPGRDPFFSGCQPEE